MFQIPQNFRQATLQCGGVFLSVLLMIMLHKYASIDRHFTSSFSQLYYDPGQEIDRLALYLAMYGKPLLSGLGADLIFALGFAAVFFLLSPKVVIWLMFALGLYLSANIEHVRYNYAHIDLGTLRFVTSRSFIEGNALTWGFFYYALIFTALAAGLSLLNRRWQGYKCFGALLVVLAVPMALFLAKPIDPLQPAWMQSHPLLPVVSDGGEGQIDDAFDDSPFVQSMPALAQSNRRHNLLIVYLEGLSQYSVERGDLPFLSSLAEKNLHLTSYFGHQLQTSNGLYSTLTGAMPNFLTSRSPWDTLNSKSPEAASALPVLFRDSGYHTAFLQSARLSFMSKGTHLKELGFETVLGQDDWAEFDQRNGWGIDDLSLFENTLTYIDAQPAEQPWMISLLTTGTHAPYNVPEKFMPNASNRTRALRYADQASAFLKEGLRKRGLLENTVVIFTSDESREPGHGSSIENEIVLNWLPFIVLHPEGSDGVVDWPVGARDFREIVLSVMKRANAESLADLIDQQTPLVFGNYLNARIFWFEKNERRLLACFTQNFLCAVFTGVDDLTALGNQQADQVVQVPALQAVFRAHEPRL